MCLGAVLICLVGASTRLSWVLNKVTASVEKQFGPSAVYGKSNRAADSLCEHLLALDHSAVEEGEVPGVEFAGDQVGEVADPHRNLTKRADDKAGNASRVKGVHLCPDGPVASAFVPSFWSGFLAVCGNLRVPWPRASGRIHRRT